MSSRRCIKTNKSANLLDLYPSFTMQNLCPNQIKLYRFEIVLVVDNRITARIKEQDM